MNSVTEMADNLVDDLNSVSPLVTAIYNTYLY